MTPEEAGIMREEDKRLERLWEAYRRATPAPEPSVNFMPELWAKIESARAVSWVDPLRWLVARLAPILAALIVAMGLYWRTADVTPASYVEVLAADLIQEVEDTI
jgi:hypothetical protein